MKIILVTLISLMGFLVHADGSTQDTSSKAQPIAMIMSCETSSVPDIVTSIEVYGNINSDTGVIDNIQVAIPINTGHVGFIKFLIPGGSGLSQVDPKTESETLIFTDVLAKGSKLVMTGKTAVMTGGGIDSGTITFSKCR